MIKIKTFVYFSLAVFGLFISFLKTGNALKCFECNSHTNESCKLKNPPESFSQTCNSKNDKINYIACRKIVQTIDFDVNGLPPDSRVIRSCAYIPQEVNKCYQRSGFGGRQEVCACNTDNCNNSIANKFNFGVLITSTVIVYLLSFFINL